MSDYTLKCDETIDDVTVGERHRPLPEIILFILTHALEEAGISIDKKESEKFVAENCFIKFVHSNIPFSIKLQ